MSRQEHQTEEKLFLAALSAIPNLGPKRLSRLYEQTGSWRNSWQAPLKTWEKAKIPQISQRIWEDKKSNFNFNKFESELKNKNISLIIKDDPNYPLGFFRLEDAPLLLYARGHWPLKKQKIITVIGSRQPSLYGEAAAKKIIPELIESGYSIASGLAIGLDSLAHSLTLSNQGHTIAILGSGLNHIYPKENYKLTEKIINNGGLIISEYALDAPPMPGNFLQRNRLLASIGEGVLVLEAGIKSGSMNTAKQAKKLKNKIYAIPGNIFNQAAEGCHQLIKNGAYLINSGGDIAKKKLEKIQNQEQEENLTIIENNIISLLKKEFSLFSGLRPDEIQFKLKLDTPSVNSTLSILEIKNLIRKRGGRYYFLPLKN